MTFKNSHFLLFKYYCCFFFARCLREGYKNILIIRKISSSLIKLNKVRIFNKKENVQKNFLFYYNNFYVYRLITYRHFQQFLYEDKNNNTIRGIIITLLDIILIRDKSVLSTAIRQTSYILLCALRKLHIVNSLFKNKHLFVFNFVKSTLLINLLYFTSKLYTFLLCI